MTRIRKRPSTAISSTKREPELHVTSNGGLQHLSPGAKANPSFQEPRESLVGSPGWVKKDRLLVGAGAASCRYGDSSGKEGKKQLAALYYSGRPYIAEPSEAMVRGNEEGMQGMVMREGEGKIDMDVEKNKEHMHSAAHGDDDDDDAEACVGKRAVKEAGVGAHMRASYAGRRGEIRSGGERAIEQYGSAQPAEDATEARPPKVLPLQLILNSESSLTAATKGSNDLHHNNNMSMMPSRRSGTSYSDTLHRPISKMAMR